MTPRGEVALIVALIGLQMNMISQRAYALVIVMTAVTTILPPPFLKMLFAPGKRPPLPLPPARNPPKCRYPASSDSPGRRYGSRGGQVGNGFRVPELIIR